MGSINFPRQPIQGFGRPDNPGQPLFAIRRKDGRIEVHCYRNRGEGEYHVTLPPSTRANPRTGLSCKDYAERWPVGEEIPLWNAAPTPDGNHWAAVIPTRAYQDEHGLSSQTQNQAISMAVEGVINRLLLNAASEEERERLQELLQQSAAPAEDTAAEVAAVIDSAASETETEEGDDSPPFDADDAV